VIADAPSGGPETAVIAHRSAYALSRFASRLADAGVIDPATLDRLARDPFDRSRMRAELEGVVDAAALADALRRLRARCLVATLARDLAGLAPLAEVTGTMTALAEESLAAACRVIGRDLQVVYGQPVGAESGLPQPMLVVGMGKLGGVELNVSSDIDLVFVYPEEGETDGPRRISCHEYFVRLGRRVIGLLNDVTPAGYVFRVDMRLRPYGESGPLACSLDMLEEYFLTQGRDWERYAWIKGRVVAVAHPGGREQGDAREAIAALDAVVQPFVFRRYLDFGAIAAMRELSRQIQREVRRRDMHDNIKLGAGGIRQIEFIAQVMQLVRGGRQPDLRARPTLEVLDRLGRHGILEPSMTTMLARHYDVLRRLEHRLQYLDDAQTHLLPADAQDRARVAQAMGYPDWTAFEPALDALRTEVAGAFEQVCVASGGSEVEHPLAWLWSEGTTPEDVAHGLAERGFSDPAALAARVVAMREGSVVRRMAAGSRARLAQLVPRALESAAGARAPDVVAARLLDVIGSIGRRESYLALLGEYPPVLARLRDLAEASPWAIEYLARHPILLDELLDARTLHAPPDWPRLLEMLRAQLDDAHGNVERQMDLLRHFRHAQLFRIVVQDLAGDLDLRTVSDHLSDLADRVLGETLLRCWRHLSPRDASPAAFGIIGYGKLGGKELGYGSDLDLAFVFDERDAGPEAAERYARLALRLNSWLTTMTSAGVLYATDLRLRPDGESGLLAPSMGAYELYQRNKAWVWEHQALTRARFVAGSAALAERFEHTRLEVLRAERDGEALRAEIVAMRHRMRAARRDPAPPGRFDIKHGEGGLVDLEFVVQYLVLAHARAHEALTANSGNIALLEVAARCGLASAPRCRAAGEAYAALRSAQHALQLAGADPAAADAGPLAAHATAVADLWAEVLRAPLHPSA
jgi:glutamate-ammonia-ligase adenylyltransferase